MRILRLNLRLQWQQWCVVSVMLMFLAAPAAPALLVAEHFPYTAESTTTTTTTTTPMSTTRVQLDAQPRSPIDKSEPFATPEAFASPWSASTAAMVGGGALFDVATLIGSPLENKDKKFIKTIYGNAIGAVSSTQPWVASRRIADTTMRQFDSQIYIRALVQNQLGELAPEHGLRISLGNSRLDIDGNAERPATDNGLGTTTYPIHVGFGFTKQAAMGFSMQSDSELPHVATYNAIPFKEGRYLFTMKINFQAASTIAVDLTAVAVASLQSEKKSFLLRAVPRSFSVLNVWGIGAIVEFVEIGQTLADVGGGFFQSDADVVPAPPASGILPNTVPTEESNNPTTTTTKTTLTTTTTTTTIASPKPTVVATEASTIAVVEETTAMMGKSTSVELSDSETSGIASTTNSQTKTSDKSTVLVENSPSEEEMSESEDSPRKKENNSEEDQTENNNESQNLQEQSDFDNSMLMIVIIVAAVVLFVAIIAAAICYSKRNSNSPNSNEKEMIQSNSSEIESNNNNDKSIPADYDIAALRSSGNSEYTPIAVGETQPGEYSFKDIDTFE